MQSPPLLRVSELSVEAATSKEYAPVVAGVSFVVGRGEILAIVGESGSGKSLTVLSLLRLNPTPGTRVSGGTVEFAGRDLLRMGARDLREVRGSAIGMVFQQPGASLNPVLTVGDQLVETMRVHDRTLPRPEARRRALELLGLVGISDPTVRIRQYPHQLSGGIAQRTAIAMAMANHPKLLLADEPTTALDVTVQAQVLQLMRAQARNSGAALVLITHNLGVVSQFADTVAVMYNGRFVEKGPVHEVLKEPTHPYTQGLLKSVPGTVSAGERLSPIPGAPPEAGAGVPGCAFHPRCYLAGDACRTTVPTLNATGVGGHEAACHFAADALRHWQGSRSD